MSWLRVADDTVRPSLLSALPPSATRLIDCDVCAGVGIMTARAVGDLEGPGTPVPCPNCGGACVFLRPTENVVPDLADWIADPTRPEPSPQSDNREAAGYRRLAAAARRQATCCIHSAITASTAKDVEEQCDLGLRYLRSASSFDAAAFAIELAAVQPRRPALAGQQ